MVKKRKPPTNRAYIYIRCSHPDSAKSGLGMEVQDEQCRQYRKELMAKYPELIRGAIFRDPAVSAWKNEFAGRPGGKELLEKVTPGDHVIFWGIKRDFRLARDGHAMLDKWREQGVHLHFVREGIDLSTAGGRAYFGMMLVMAQHEAEDTSERNKAAAAKQRAAGFVTSGHPAKGFVRVQEPGGKRDVPADPWWRSIMQEVARLHDEEGLTFAKTGQRVYDRICKHEGKHKGLASLNGWSVQQTRQHYLREKRLQEQGL